MESSWVVIKFGGTSVSSLKNWHNIVEIIQAHRANGHKVLVVCSAYSQISNKLETLLEAALLKQHQPLLLEIITTYQNLADQMGIEATLDTLWQDLEDKVMGIALLNEVSHRTRAQVLACGELAMTRIGERFLNAKKINCQWFDAREAIKTQYNEGASDYNNYMSAQSVCTTDQALIQKLEDLNKEVVITQGFIASNAQDHTVLLGRGGSDTSAAYFASKIDAKFCEIWTDVPGIYSANPHHIPEARLLKQLDYDEAQEIASMGAKVLHPNCITPLKTAAIPLFVKYTAKPCHEGTCISLQKDIDSPPIKAVQAKYHVSLISIDTMNMWQQVGFLADVFACFKKHKYSIDLISTSESNVTVSLDSVKNDAHALEALLKDLNQFSNARLIEPCASISLVGHQIRTILHQLTPVLEAFEAQQVYLMSLAANDLNLTFVVSAPQVERLTKKLHLALIENHPTSAFYSKSWIEEFGHPQSQKTKDWWLDKQDALLKKAASLSPCYVYDQQSLQASANQLLSLTHIDAIFYAIKANPYPEVLETFYKQGLGFECVSLEEVEHVLNLWPNIDKHRILFTPNFASRHEYQAALAYGVFITIDSLYPLQNWPQLFANRSIILRVDPGVGQGHHKYVCTGGSESKFGIPLSDLTEAHQIAIEHQIKVIGLHSHYGSGILQSNVWQDTAKLLTSFTQDFPDLKIINLGGGLGVTERRDQVALDLEAVDASLLPFKKQYPKLQFWLEPGRFLVAKAGVLLAKVTQVKSKGDIHFIGLETGMNSLIRPSLYGSYHEIVNLSKLHQPPKQLSHIVGPICESGDTLGYSRMMPETHEGDILLIANAGAYGHAMSSKYNLRPPALQYLLPSHKQTSHSTTK